MDWIVAALIVLGTAFALIGSLGLLRMGDFYLRLHGPTKITTFGLGCLLLASVLHFASRGRFGLHEILVSLFLFITAPVSAHLLAKAALHLHLPSQASPPRRQGG
ncbi:Na+/H+ antiporter subunit G [Thiomonas sp.]|jgi:multicomponent K+:H+ antiporter subunit G|uniref:Na+/H+ antiporter subunit G n=1 Tax=Thiomonas sp. TaxID=2047785 RepID=UPI00261AC307|nr:Na+/H+ antiporter subunit G [Thiomonas sp.]